MSANPQIVNCFVYDVIAKKDVAPLPRIRAGNRSEALRRGHQRRRSHVQSRQRQADCIAKAPSRGS